MAKSKSGRYRSMAKAVQNKKMNTIAKKAIMRASETKIFCRDHSTGFTFSTIPINKSLASVDAGDGSSQREGIEIQPTYLKIRFYLTAGDNYNACRVMLIQKRGDQALSATIHNHGVLSCLGTDFTQHFNIIVDKVLMVKKDAGGASNSNFYEWKIPRSKFKKLYWTKSDPIGSDATKGALYLRFVSDSAASPNPKIYFDSQLFYKDL